MTVERAYNFVQHGFNLLKLLLKYDKLGHCYDMECA